MATPSVLHYTKVAGFTFRFTIGTENLTDYDALSIHTAVTRVGHFDLGYLQSRFYHILLRRKIPQRQKLTRFNTVPVRHEY